MPPLKLTVALPLLPPLQETFVCEEMLGAGLDWFAITATAVRVQLPLSEIVTIYVPGARPLMEVVVAPEAHK